MVDASFYLGQGEDPDEENRVTRNIKETVARVIAAPPRYGEGETVREALAAMSGKIEVGDYVKTLHLTKAVYGKVTGTRRKGKVLILRGRTQPGAPLVTRETSPENLELHFRAGTLPEDLRGHYE